MSGLCMTFKAEGRISIPPKTWWLIHRVAFLFPGRATPGVGNPRADNRAPGSTPLKLLQAWDEFRATSVFMLDNPRKNRPHSGFLGARSHRESRIRKRFGSCQSVWWHGTIPALLQQTRRRGQLVTKSRERGGSGRRLLCQLCDLGFEPRNLSCSGQSGNTFQARSRDNRHTFTLGPDLVLLQLNPAPVGQLVDEHGRK